MERNFKVIWHYDEDDTDFCEDYYSVEVFENDKKIFHLADEYHDHSTHWLEGFFSALTNYTNDEINVETVEIADGMTR